MIPFLFGTRERPLFGIHTPAGGNRRRRGALICAPWSQEYQRAHRALRLLAERLAGSGYDVMRFDYYGTGDSGGEPHELTLAGAMDDASAALEELCARADVRRALVVGMRMGALVAHRLTLDSRAVDALALWDPVVDDVDAFEPTGVKRTLIVTSHDEPRFQPLAQRLRHGGDEVEHRHMPGSPAWQEEAALGVGAVPIDILDAIAGWES